MPTMNAESRTPVATRRVSDDPSQGALAWRLLGQRASAILGTLAGSTLSAEMGQAHRLRRFDNST